MPSISSFGREDYEPEPAGEQTEALMPPGVALISVVPVLDTAKLDEFRRQLTAIVAQAFRDGFAEALEADDQPAT